MKFVLAAVGVLFLSSFAHARQPEPKRAPKPDLDKLLDKLTFTKDKESSLSTTQARWLRQGRQGPLPACGPPARGRRARHRQPEVNRRNSQMSSWR